MNIGKSFAQAFSIILNPLLIAFYNIALLAVYTRFFVIYANLTWRILGIVFLFTFIMPVLFILVLKSFRVIENFSLVNKKDRILPYGVTCFANMSLCFYFYGVGFHIWFLSLLAVPVFILIIGSIINAFWKISAHMLGIGMLLGSTMSICFNVNKENPFLLYILLIILAGCLGVSRLYLKRSTPAQVYTGFSVGFVIAFLVIWVGITFGLRF